jgi:hypothetical protein
MAGNLKYRIDTVINQEMRDGIETICAVNIIAPSVYLRQLIVRNLIEEGIIERPTVKRKEISGAEDAVSAP